MNQNVMLIDCFNLKSFIFITKHFIVRLEINKTEVYNEKAFNLPQRNQRHLISVVPFDTCHLSKHIQFQFAFW